MSYCYGFEQVKAKEIESEIHTYQIGFFRKHIRFSNDVINFAGQGSPLTRTNAQIYNRFDELIIIIASCIIALIQDQVILHMFRIQNIISDA